VCQTAQGSPPVRHHGAHWILEFGPGMRPVRQWRSILAVQGEATAQPPASQGTCQGTAPLRCQLAEGGLARLRCLDWDTDEGILGRLLLPLRLLLLHSRSS